MSNRFVTFKRRDRAPTHRDPHPGTVADRRGRAACHTGIRDPVAF
jgi:hypothetical protein